MDCRWKMPICFLEFLRLKLKAHTFVIKRCRRRNNITVRCIMSPQWGARCCVKMDLTVASPHTMRGEKRRKKTHHSFFVVKYAWVFSRAQCLSLCQNLNFLFKKRKISGSLCESCMPLFLSVLVSQRKKRRKEKKTDKWQDHPFLKRQAALQLWSGTISLIQRDTSSPRPRGHTLWPDSSRH